MFICNSTRFSFCYNTAGLLDPGSNQPKKELVVRSTICNDGYDASTVVVMAFLGAT